jgi:hypothetical protein
LITSQAYRNLFPNMTSTTFPAVTMLRSGWSTYVCIFCG